MKIAIFAGGSGSEALQNGLFECFGRSVDYSIIINAYDAGLSTGLVRKVCDGKILGPSDLRKNQLLRYHLTYGNTPLLSFLKERVTRSPKEMKDYIEGKILELKVEPENEDMLLGGLETYFASPMAYEIDYIDFSVANILYAGVAKLNDYSLKEAGIFFANLLNIPEDAVLLNSDENFYLTAVTESGHTILDEGDIVSWNNPDDKIVDIKLLTSDGHEGCPTLDEITRQVLLNCDMIIFSSGTQWSSLIPTYVTRMLGTTLNRATPVKYLVMNLTEDKDMIGVKPDEFLATVKRYLDFKEINIIADSQMMTPTLDPNMIIDNLAYAYAPVYGTNMSSKHSSTKLVKTIFNNFYREALKNDYFIFDYDDTIVARGGANKIISDNNVSLLREFKKHWSICTGNTIKAIIPFNTLSDTPIYADGGINLYFENKVECIAPELLFTEAQVETIIKFLTKIKIPLSKIQNRGNAIIAIKPIANEYRPMLAELLELKFPLFEVKITGRSTVELCKEGLNKSILIKVLGQPVTYVGDEPWGNDREVANQPNVTFVHVNNVNDTNMLLKVLSWQV